MADEPTITPGTTPDASGQNNGGGKPDGAEPTKTDTGAGEGTAIDTSKWTDKEWETVYKDPKLYDNPRFKNLNDRAKKAAELETAAQKAEEDKLKANQEWEKLAQMKEQETTTWKQKAENATIDNQIAMEAQKSGVVDLEAVTKLIDRKDIKLGDDGTATGVAEAVKALIDSKPYLKGGKGNNTNIGSGTAPGDDTATTPRFKLSQLQDPVFFRAHEKEIDKAFQLGQIENDMGKTA